MPADQVSPSAPDFLAFQNEISRILPGLNLARPGPDEPTTRRLREFCALLLHWNATLNLTGSRTLVSLVQEHLPDALVLAEEVPPDAALLDVGSGGGLPALPLAILRPDLHVHLVEPRAKRVAFLRTAVRELGLKRVYPVVSRIEDFVIPEGGFLAAVSRATFSPSEWVARGRGLVRPEGYIFALLTAESPDDFPVGARFRPYRLLGGQGRQLAIVRT